MTNAAESVGRPARSIFAFLQLNGLKAVLGASFEFSDFAVESAQKPIVGIPPEIATIYWTYQLSYRLAGKSHMSISRFLESSLFKALLQESSEFLTFTVVGAQKPIVGIPPELANLYWVHYLYITNP